MSRNTTLTAPLTLLLAIGVALMPTAAYAAGVPLTPSGAMISTFSFITSILIVAMNTFTWILFMLLDLVLNPVWIFDLGSGSLTNMLREIWQLCRDLVNLALAFVLIAGAIMMIVTSDSSKIKEKLPKFVMALVLVNFSWFIPRVIFDISQIATFTVYSIPSLLGADGCVLPPDGNRPARPCEIAINYAFFNQTEMINPRTGQLLGPGGGVISTGWKCLLRPLVCVQFAPVGSPQAQQNAQMHTNVLNGLIVNHARLQQLVRISDPRPIPVGPAPGGAFDQVAASLMFLVKMVVILLFHVAIFFPLLAMVAAFFMRIPILWVTMAFMPLVALWYVMGDKMGEFDTKKLFMDEFLKVVFLPAKVAVPFTIGFIMVNAGASAAPPAILGQALPISLFSGVRSVWQLLWMIVAMFIIWKYSFETLKSGGDNVNKFTDKIQGYGQGAFQYAGKAVTNTPFIPIGQGRASLADVGNALNPNTGLGNIRAGRPWQGPVKNLMDALEARGRGGPNGANKVKEEITRNRLDEPTIKEIRNNVSVVINPGTNDAEASRNLGLVLDTLRNKSGDRVRGVTETEAVEGLIAAMRLSPAEAARLRATVARRPGANTPLR